MAKTPQGFFFYLADTLARQVESHADFFERHRLIITETKVETQNFLLTCVKGFEHLESDERKRIYKILRETKKDLPTAWQGGPHD